LLQEKSCNLQKKKEHPKVKSQLHPRSQHRERYNFDELIKSSPELATFVAPNKYGDDSVDFFNPKAVLALNKALLKHHYGVEFWEIPEHYLCPPIPGRADYIHNIADLLKGTGSEIPKGKQCLWFTSLISKEVTLKPTYKILQKVKATDVKTIEMGQGQKVSRFIAWTFLSEEQQKQWIAERW